MHASSQTACRRGRRTSLLLLLPLSGCAAAAPSAEPPYWRRPAELPAERHPAPPDMFRAGNSAPAEHALWPAPAGEARRDAG